MANNDKKNDTKYIMIPIYKLQSLFIIDAKMLFEDCLCFGIYYYAEKNNKTYQEAAYYLGITPNRDSEKRGANEYVRYNQGDVLVSVNLDVIFNFKDNKKAEFEILQLAYYLAIKSILGVKNHVRTSKNLIIARAFGFKTWNEFRSSGNYKVKIIKKYMKRYWVDKILQELQFSWDLLIYARNMRGMVIGLGSKTTIEDMIYYAKGYERKGKLNELKTSVLEAEKKVLQQLKKDSSETAAKQQRKNIDRSIKTASTAAS